MPPTIVGGFDRPAVRLGPSYFDDRAGGVVVPRFLPWPDFPRPNRAFGGGSGEPAAPPRRTRQVFVAYPYGLFDRADYRGVFTAVGKAYGVKFVFADERITNLQVAEKIRNQIHLSDFSLFDVTGWNANVAFELGMAYEMQGVDWYICFNPAKSGESEVLSNIRGLDRLEYRGFSGFREQLTLLLEQWYPPDARVTQDEFAEKMKARIVDLLRDHPDGLVVRQIAKSAGINPEMAALAVRQLKKDGKLIRRGTTSSARYRLKKTNGAAV